MWKIENKTHYQKRGGDPLIVSLINALFNFHLLANSVVHEVFTDDSVKMLANYIGSFDPTSGLDLFRVLFVAWIRLAFDWLATM